MNTRQTHLIFDSSPRPQWRLTSWLPLLSLAVLLLASVPKAEAYGWSSCGPQGGAGWLIIDPTNSDHLIYAVGDHHSLYETTDGGEIWHGLGEPFEDETYIISMDTSRYPIIDVITRKDVESKSVAIYTPYYRQSLDGGRSWSSKMSLPDGIDAEIIQASARSGLLYVFARSGLHNVILKSANEGQHWESSGTLPEFLQSYIGDMALRPGTPDRLFVCGDKWIGSSTYAFADMLAFSDDGGTSWTDLSDMLPQTPEARSDYGLTSLAKVSADDSKMYAAGGSHSGYGPVLRSSDGAQSWQWSEQPLYGAPLLRVDPFDPNHLVLLGYTETESKLLAWGYNYVISRDGGATWSPQKTRFGMEAIDLVFDPSVRDRVYMRAFQGLFRSDDGGENWTRIDNGIREARVWDAAVSGDRIYTLKAHEGICHSGDAGGLWWLPRNGDAPTTECFALAVDPVRRARLLAVEDPRLMTFVGYLRGSHHVFRSSDGGSSWELSLDSDYLWTAVAFHPSHTGFAYAVGSGPSWDGTIGLADGLYFCRSNDYGKSWTAPVPITGNLAKALEARVVAVAPSDDQTVYVAGIDLANGYSDLYHDDYFDAMIYRSEDEGLTWVDARGNLRAFGQAKGGARAVTVDPVDPLHVFLATGLGVFETHNGGQTWTPAMDRTLSVFDLALDPVANFLYAATENGVQRATLPDMTWETVLSANDQESDSYYTFSEEAWFSFPNLTIDPENRYLYLSGSDHGLLRFDLDQYNAASDWVLYR